MDTIFGRLQDAERTCAELTQSLFSRDMDCSAKDHQIASLVAENEQLKGGVADYILLKDATISTAKTQINELKVALAAAEAREAKLLNDIRNLHPWNATPNDIYRIRECIYYPRDDTALREIISGIYSDCVMVCDNLTYPYSNHIQENEKDTWVIGTYDCADAIRALAEKERMKNGN